MWISNSASKVFILVFIVVAGWAVLGGRTRVKDPHNHFKDATLADLAVRAEYTLV